MRRTIAKVHRVSAVSLVKMDLEGGVVASQVTPEMIKIEEKTSSVAWTKTQRAKKINSPKRSQNTPRLMRKSIK